MIPFDNEKMLSFPTADGRELLLKVNLVSGQATISETLDGETETISTCTTEIQTIAKYIGMLEQTQTKRELSTTIPITTTPTNTPPATIPNTLIS